MQGTYYSGGMLVHAENRIILVVFGLDECCRPNALGFDRLELLLLEGLQARQLARIFDVLRHPITQEPRSAIDRGRL